MGNTWAAKPLGNDVKQRLLASFWPIHPKRTRTVSSVDKYRRRKRSLQSYWHPIGREVEAPNIPYQHCRSGSQKTGRCRPSRRKHRAMHDEKSCNFLCENRWLMPKRKLILLLLNDRSLNTLIRQHILDFICAISIIEWTDTYAPNTSSLLYLSFDRHHR